MSTLLIEHPISDIATWRAAFDRFAPHRLRAGVLRERILQPVGDPHYVLVDLDFASVDEARRFQTFLETQVWADPASSPALAGTPRARVAVPAPTP